MSLALSPRERARLKARAHPLAPVVQLGGAGLTDAVVGEVDRALTAHELIKVRVAVADRGDRDEVCEALAAKTGAAQVQRVGRVLVLWRPRPDERQD